VSIIFTTAASDFNPYNKAIRWQL